MRTSCEGFDTRTQLTSSKYCFPIPPPSMEGRGGKKEIEPHTPQCAREFPTTNSRYTIRPTILKTCSTRPTRTSLRLVLSIEFKMSPKNHIQSYDSKPTHHLTVSSPSILIFVRTASVCSRYRGFIPGCRGARGA
jgi:hypothetical protein